MSSARGALGLAACFVVLLVGCADVVDTELGLDAEIDSAAVTVSGGVVSGSFDVTYRVGGFAEGDRSFQAQAIDLFVAGAAIGTIVPEAPPEFDPVLSPGESRSVTFTGEARGVTDPSALCGATVTVLLRWTDRATGELGMFETTTENVTCS